jgi:hydrogenase maturation protease
MAVIKQPTSLVVACGNASRGDDAFGPLVISRLNELHLQGITAVDLGLRPDLLIEHLPGVKKLIVVDAVSYPHTPAGLIVALDWPTMQKLPDRPTGTHGISLLAELQLADRLGILPPVVRLIGVTIGQTELESPPLPVIVARADDAVDRIAQALGLDLVKVRTAS